MNRWQRLRESFWFVPGLLCAFGFVLAEVLIAVDRRITDTDLGPLAVLVNQIGVGGSRDVLGAIAGSMLTVAATMFSITIAVLALASSTYGPRLVRNFMSDRGNQLVLGVLVATFLYALLVLRSVGGRDFATGQVFVPHLAVNVAVLLAVLSIGVLVYFINHISDSVQVGTLSRRVRTELVAVVDRLYPEEMGRSRQEASSEVERDEGAERVLDEAVVVSAPRTGYVQWIAEQRLLLIAEEHDLVLRLRVRPGSHVIEGRDLAMLWPADRAGKVVCAEVRSAFGLAQERNPHQDIEFAVLVLEEMAVRALSPSTNDPYTALNAVDDLAAGLTRLAGRGMPSPYRYDGDGRLRVIAPRIGLIDLLDRVFDAMRIYAVDHPSVLRRTVELAAQVGAASRVPAVCERLIEHVGSVVEAFERREPHSGDLARLRHLATHVIRELRTCPTSHHDPITRVTG